MDDALVQNEFESVKPVAEVLILVVMDDALVPVSGVGLVRAKSLNPCCNG